MNLCRALLLPLLILVSTPAFSGELVGIPTITDGDTVVLRETKIRLLDMDAPETDQFCLDAQGQAWNCGIDAREALKAQVKGEEWRCQGEKNDRYGRLLASCTVRGENISRWMVKAGWAMSPIQKGYSHRFDKMEAKAREGNVGLWAGAFIAPWDWRLRNCKTEILGSISVPIDAQQRLCGSPSKPPDPNCTIKATLRSDQCIYHQEGGRYYGKIRMEGPNKRWFCSKIEAESAGCRPAK
jgi:endonuclease YncB( thermonuclease family)